MQRYFLSFVFGQKFRHNEAGPNEVNMAYRALVIVADFLKKARDIALFVTEFYSFEKI